MTPDPIALTERLHCIHVLERRMLKLRRDVQYVEADDKQRRDWEMQHKALAEAADEMRNMPFEANP